MIETLNLIPIDDIAPNPYQPRLKFKPEELEELSRSSVNQIFLVMSSLQAKDVLKHQKWLV